MLFKLSLSSSACALAACFQLAAFRELMEDADHHIVDNFRPLQEPGDRFVYTNDEAATGDDDAAASLSALSALSVAAATVIARVLV